MPDLSSKPKTKLISLFFSEVMNYFLKLAIWAHCGGGGRRGGIFSPKIFSSDLDELEEWPEKREEKGSRALLGMLCRHCMCNRVFNCSYVGESTALRVGNWCRKTGGRWASKGNHIGTCEPKFPETSSYSQGAKPLTFIAPVLFLHQFPLKRAMFSPTHEHSINKDKVPLFSPSWLEWLEGGAF